MSTLLDELRASLGVHETAGPDSNPEIIAYFKDCGWTLGELGEDSTVAWCAARMGSALKRCGYPIPPKNVNLTARSYCTYGVACDPQPGAIGVIARGTSSWQGHVFLIESILPDGWWQTIGGNQGSLGEVSRSIVDPSKSQVLAVRMPVVATVEALRTAGSTTIKGADTDEKLGIIGTVFVPIFEGIKSVTEHMLGLAEAPSFTSLPESLTWWGSVIEQASRVWKYAYDQPWMAAVLIVSVGMVVRAKITKRGRVAEHAAGVPIASEVAAQGST